MSTKAFVVYPAIDLRAGRVVRLRQGDPQEETVFGDDPAAIAGRWEQEGASWLHVVNLDGALGVEDNGTHESVNLIRLDEITRKVRANVQFGGGIRTLPDIERLLSRGVRRVVLGTVALRQPRIIADALREFGAERIVVALDARHGLVVTGGWQEASGMPVGIAATRMAALGVQRILYTDVARDGTMAGAAIDETMQLAQGSGLQVIASGGVSTLEDISTLATHAHQGVEGVIVGQALYTGAISLREALEVVAQAGG